MARSDELAIDLREVGQAVASFVEGKGGGGASLVEIVTDRRGRLEAALELALTKIQGQL
jgi:alanyl-tRNA synthetase